MRWSVLLLIFLFVLPDRLQSESRFEFSRGGIGVEVLQTKGLKYELRLAPEQEEIEIEKSDEHLILSVPMSSVQKELVLIPENHKHIEHVSLGPQEEERTKVSLEVKKSLRVASARKLDKRTVYFRLKKRGKKGKGKRAQAKLLKASRQTDPVESQPPTPFAAETPELLQLEFVLKNEEKPGGLRVAFSELPSVTLGKTGAQSYRLELGSIRAEPEGLWLPYFAPASIEGFERVELKRDPTNSLFLSIKTIPDTELSLALFGSELIVTTDR